MSLSTNASSVLARLDELQAVLVIGKRSVPFLEETLRFVREMIPLLDEVDESIRDSVGQMPSATSQITSVSQATESATTEILDLVDSVLSHIDECMGRTISIAEYAEAVQQHDDDLHERLRDALRTGPSSLLAGVEAAFNDKRQHLQQLRDKIEAQETALNAMRRHMTSIMVALQVQDITSQQLASVNHLIESVRSRMASLVNAMSASGEQVDATRPIDEGTFDARARYDTTQKRQHDADQVVRSFRGCGYNHAIEHVSPAPRRNEGDPSTRKDAQADQPGSTGAGDGHALDCSVASNKTEHDDSGGGAATQDDIDALFRQFGM